MRRPLLAVLFATATAGAQHQHAGGVTADSTGLGTVSFANSGAAAAQRDFLRGLALLHSFEYDDAATAFKAARARDRRFALPVWMEALTYRHGAWSEEDLPAARRVLAALGPTPQVRLAKAGSVRERAFGASVEALFAPRPERERVRAWADSLRAQVKAHPGDPEWATFASVAIMDAMLQDPPHLRGAARDEAVTLAEQVFARFPGHPGAAHFVIHANDEPSRAARAEQAARAYATIAPNAEHALHMPSHIFLQLGLWDDAVASNVRAWAASTAWVRERKRGAADLSWHSLQWLMYGLLQQGRHRAAADLLDTATTYIGVRSDTIAGIDVRFTIPALRFLLGANGAGWRAPAIVASPPDGNARGTNMARNARYHHAVAALHANDTAELRRTLTTGGVPLDAGMRGQLDALVALRRGDTVAAVAALRREAARDTLPFVGPPLRQLAAELLGDLLLTKHEYAEAVLAYQQVLRQCPRRVTGLLGLARALRGNGDTVGSRRAYAELLGIWHAADADLPALAEVRAGAQG